MTKAETVKAAKTPQPEDDAPLLVISSLSKKTERIDIDFGSGKLEPYHFVNLDAIGIRERQTISDLLGETFELGGKSVTKKLSRKDNAKYDAALRKLTLLILPKMTAKKMGDGRDPEDGLGTGHMSDIAVAFFVSSGESVPDRIELTRRMQNLADSLPSRTGAKSSQDSRGSTNRRARRRRG